MKPKTMILMAVAIVCGLGASYMTSRLLAERGNEKQETPKVNVLVAKKNLDNGTPLKKPGELFEVKEFLKGQEPRDAVANFEVLKNKYLKRNLRKGDFVTTKDIDDNQTILPLPPGKVAVGLRVTSEQVAAGFAAAPGSKVNIVWTIRGNNNLVAQSLTLLEDILVVASDQQINRAEDGSVKPANVVTVALTEEEALKVTLAKEVGSVTLNLRSSTEDSNPGVASSGKVTMQDLLKGKNLNPELIKELTGGEPLPVDPVKLGPSGAPPNVDFQFGTKEHVVWIKDQKGIRKQTFVQDERGNWLLKGVSQIQDAPAPAPNPALNPEPPAVNPLPPQGSGPAAGNPASGPANGSATPASGSGPVQKGAQ